MPQCETTEALENIEEITAIEGIDGIFVGPFDLSISMGIPAQFNNPGFQQALERVLAACKQNNKLCMIFSTGIDEAKTYIKHGFDAVANNIDTMVFMRAYQEMLDDLRAR